MDQYEEFYGWLISQNPELWDLCERLEKLAGLQDLLNTLENVDETVADHFGVEQRPQWNDTRIRWGPSSI